MSDSNRSVAIALLLGRGGSTGFPGKNLYSVLGRPLMAYPLMAANTSKYVEATYVSTDDEMIAKTGKRYGANNIKRPPELCTKEARGEDAFEHGYRVISKNLALEGKSIELLVLLLANAATVTASLIDEGIEILRSNPEADSAVSVSRYNMWSPLRARQIDGAGYLKPFVPFEAIGNVDELNCNRDSQGDVYFADMGVSVVRPRCFENMEDGLLPQKWMGRNIKPILSEAGCDIDYPWQLPGVELWLNQNGISPAEPNDGEDKSE